MSSQNMAEKMEFNLSLSKLPWKSIPSVNYKLKVPNFFTLSNNDGASFEAESPSFEFGNATWNFRIVSREREKAEILGGGIIKEFFVQIQRLNSEVAEHTICYRLSLLDENDKPYKEFFDTNLFKEDDKDVIMDFYDNENPFYDTREILTLIIRLILVEPPEVNAQQVVLSKSGGKDTGTPVVGVISDSDSESEYSNENGKNVDNNDKDSKSSEEGESEDEDSSENEMDDITNCNISISESPNKIAFTSATYTVKVPNFFTLPEYDGICFKAKSPLFEFANARWWIRFRSGNKWKSEIGEWIKQFSTSIIRVNYDDDEQRIFYEILLLDADDKVYMKHGGTHFFTDVATIEETNLHDFDNGNPFCDKRDTLTLIINLIFSDPTKLDADTIPVSTDKDIHALSYDFKKLFLNGKKHDLTLRVSGKEFRVHQDVLTVRSQVFEDLLSSDTVDKNEGVIDVPDCDPQAMEQFLIYIYSGKVETLDEDNALGLYYVAHKYNMALLKEKCSEFIKQSLSPLKICDVIQLALNHRDSNLLECATKYFLDHTREIFPTLEWISFFKANPDAANELLIKASKKWDSDK